MRFGLPSNSLRFWAIFRMRITSFVEKMAFQAGLAVLRGLDPVQASNFGAAVAGRFGPPLPVSRVAERNLSLAFPALDGQARRHLVRMMWESLGRTMAELPHLAELTTSTSGPGWEVASKFCGSRPRAAVPRFSSLVTLATGRCCRRSWPGSASTWAAWLHRRWPKTEALKAAA